MEFESFNEGTLLLKGLQVGQSAKVDDLLAIIGPEGTDITGIKDNFKSGKENEIVKIIEQKIVDEQPTVEKADKIQKNNQEISFPVESKNERIFISPLANKIAKEKGISINQIKFHGSLICFYLC